MKKLLTSLSSKFWYLMSRAVCKRRHYKAWIPVTKTIDWNAEDGCKKRSEIIGFSSECVCGHLWFRPLIFPKGKSFIPNQFVNSKLEIDPHTGVPKDE